VEQRVAAKIIKAMGAFAPEIAFILGSGSSDLISLVQSPKFFSYQDLGLAGCQVAGHQGQMCCGTIHGQDVVFFQGRFHWYEGHSPQVMRQLVTVAHALGVQQLLITNASGSLQPHWQPGSLVVITDHINGQGRSPLEGLNQGNRCFVALDQAYHPDLIQQLQAQAKKQALSLHAGVYYATLGPQFETVAEIKSFRSQGADIIGMSTVSEVIMARYFGMNVAAIAMITNLACGLSAQSLSHEVTLQGAQTGLVALTQLLKGFLQQYCTLPHKQAIEKE
jgi:inosine/guanosine/xanthosine phosphorylase family protein